MASNSNNDLTPNTPSTTSSGTSEMLRSRNNRRERVTVTSTSRAEFTRGSGNPWFGISTGGFGSSTRPRTPLTSVRVTVRSYGGVGLIEMALSWIEHGRFARRKYTVTCTAPDLPIAYFSAGWSRRYHMQTVYNSSAIERCSVTIYAADEKKKKWRSEGKRSSRSRCWYLRYRIGLGTFRGRNARTALFL